MKLVAEVPGNLLLAAATWVHALPGACGDKWTGSWMMQYLDIPYNGALQQKFCISPF
jgi:hypothetical protein